MANSDTDFRTDKPFSKKNINWIKDIMPHIQARLVLWASLQIVPTLRGMFYFLVSINVLENTPYRYDYLSRFTARAREKSEIAYEIRSKNGKEYVHIFKTTEILPIDCFADNVRRIIDIDDIYETPEQFFDRGTKYYVKDISENYIVPRWDRQPHYVEVWVEKDAMAGTLNSIINVAGKREVRIVPTRGQESVTFAWQSKLKLEQKQKQGKKVHIRYVGDLDPSGEAIEEELINKLTVDPYKLEGIDFKRIGVTNDQRIRFKLIPNKDPKTMKKLGQDPNRFKFMEKYDLQSEDDLFQIEADALEAIKPDEFRTLVLESVDEFFDEDIYQHVLDETPTKEDLNKLALKKTRKLSSSLQKAYKKQYAKSQNLRKESEKHDQ